MKMCYFIEPFKNLRNAISGKAGTEHFLKPLSLILIWTGFRSINLY